MAALRRVLSRLYAFCTPGRTEREMAREIEAHLALVQDDHHRRGLTAEEARRAARVALGGVESVKERYRETRSFTVLEDLRRDVVYAVRTLRNTPVATAVAVLSLALGIGATAAVYSTMDWLLNRDPRGVFEPDRVLSLQVTDRAHPAIGTVGLSFPQYRALSEFQDAFIGLASYGKTPGVVSSDASADQAVFEYATGNYFELLGVRPARGRIISPQDDVQGAAPVAMLSYAYWQSHFGGDPGVLDRTLRLNGYPCRVIGIVPPEFEGYNLDWNGPTSVWMPVQTAESVYRQKIREYPVPFMRVVGRLRPEITQEMVEQRASAWMKRLPYGRSGTFEATDLAVRRSSEMRIRYRDGTARVLSILFAVCVLILLAAGLNAANFLLNRGVLRRREVAVRTALGATRGRLVRQLLTESLLIALCATGVGVLLSVGIADILAPLHRMYLGVAAGDLSSAGAIDARMGLVAATLGGASILVFGLVPALLTSRSEPIGDLKQKPAHWTWSGIRVTFRQALLVLQVAASVALAIPAGLYARSFLKIASVTTVYGHPESVLVATLVARGGTPGTVEIHDRLLSALNARPEVVSATVSGTQALSAGSGSTTLPGPENRREHATSMVGPRYFETAGIPILAGRDFSGSEQDNQTAIIVNEVLAQVWWPNRNAVGEALVYAKGTSPRVVVGVVADNRCRYFLSDPMPCAWVPFKPFFGATMAYLQIRTRGAPLAFVPSLKELVHTLDPDAAIADEATLVTRIQEKSAVDRFSALVSAALASIGIALLAVGCAALFLSMVRDSVRELAIRIALGASGRTLARRIVGQGLLILVPGTVIGLAIARVLGLRIADQLYRVAPMDPVTFLSVPLAIIAVGLAAVGYASRVATNIDPAQHLQRE